MKLEKILIYIGLLTLFQSCKPWLYYKIKNIHGVVYDTNGDPILVQFNSRNHITVDSCKNLQIDTFLRTLILGRHGRIELEHLLTTSANITINISEKVGIIYKDGKYRVIAGMTWLEKGKTSDLIINEASITRWSEIFNRDKYVYVYENNRIEIFKGSIQYANDRSYELNDSNVTILDWTSDGEIKNFSLDSIRIEPFLHPELLYKNFQEFYYFCGLHEIYHTHPENIEIQENSGDQEFDAFELENKAFKTRKRVNRKKVNF